MSEPLHRLRNRRRRRCPASCRPASACSVGTRSTATATPAPIRATRSIRAVLDMSPAEVGSLVKDATLLGRGGAGFPAGAKWGFCPPGVWPRYIVVNGDESEPGTYKDRVLMERDPHQLIEGCLIAAYAIGAAQVFLYVRGEMPHAQERIAAALNEAYAANLVGQNILGTDFSVDIVLHWGAGAYIVGEETALIESLEGNRGMPRLKPPFFPAAKGLYLKPTIVNNVETLSNLPWLMHHGVDAFRSVGTEASPGTRLIALSGHVNNAGRVRDPPGHDHLPRTVRGRALRRRHPRRPRAQDVHPRRRVGAVVLPRAGRPAAGGSDHRRRRARCSAPVPSSSWTRPPTRSGPACASCGSSPASRAASARRAARARRGRRRSSSASSTATAARATSTCCSTSPTTSVPGPYPVAADPDARPRRRAVPAPADDHLPARPVVGRADHLGPPPVPPRVRGEDHQRDLIPVAAEAPWPSPIRRPRTEPSHVDDAHRHRSAGSHV